MHLFVDISAHGLGHLAIAAPVAAALRERVPDLAITVRSRLPHSRLAQRIAAPFRHIEAASDFGFHMEDALRVDRAASAAAYRRAHADWNAAVTAEADFLGGLAPDLVLSSVAYLPLAGAAQAGIPAAALCPLNWADLFAHFFGGESWAPAIHAQMLAAYRSARVFLCPAPSMAMPGLANTAAIAPIAARGRRRDLGVECRAVLVALGGFEHRLPVDDWPRVPGIRWVVPQAWGCTHPDALAFEPLGYSFTDLLASADAVVTKPGYGTFAEAACNGTPLLYQRREDWPEQDCLIAWLERAGRCREVGGEDLRRGRLAELLERLWEAPGPTPPAPDGADEAAQALLRLVDQKR